MKPEKTGKSRKFFIAAIVIICLIAAAAEIILISGASKKKEKKTTPTEAPTKEQEAKKPTATPTEPADPKTQVYTVWRKTKQYSPDPSGKEMLYREWEYAVGGYLTAERIYDPYSGLPVTTTTTYSADLKTSCSKEFSTDQQLMEVRTRNYDDEGRVLDEVLEQTGIDGTAHYHTVWTYDESGRELNETRYVGEDEAWDYTVSYQYEGALMTYRMDTPTGTREMIKYRYDNDGNLLLEQQILADGSVGSFDQYTYKDGLLIGKDHYYSEGNPGWIIVYEYDEEGRLIHQYENDEPRENPNTYTFWRDYFYDEYGREIRSKGYAIRSANSDGLIDDLETVYDENGCKIKEIYHDTYGTGKDSVDRYEYIQTDVPYRNLTDEEKELFGLS